MAILRWVLLLVGVALFGTALAGAALHLKSGAAGQDSPLATPPAEKPPKPGRFSERQSDRFRIVQPAQYEFSPSQITRDMARRHVTGGGGQPRVWHEVAPQSNAPMPLVILLHGAGRDGLSLIEMWKDVAVRHRIALVAPDSRGTTWSLDDPDPGFIAGLVDQMAALHPIDRDRVYLFGHSAGAAYAQLLLNRFDGPWSAAVLHAGYAPPELLNSPGNAKPFRSYMGEHEHVFSIETARRMGVVLAQAGHDNELIVIPGHTHWLYQAGPQIAQDAWTWFQRLTP